MPSLFHRTTYHLIPAETEGKPSSIDGYLKIAWGIVRTGWWCHTVPISEVGFTTDAEGSEAWLPRRWKHVEGFFAPTIKLECTWTSPEGGSGQLLGT